MTQPEVLRLLLVGNRFEIRQIPAEVSLAGICALQMYKCPEWHVVHPRTK